ncbi:MAG: hypothetical protein FJ255_06330 [Phycisphaerae bacterium]|nr:hypothetical protein [Phycisphaerae bacterium]
MTSLAELWLPILLSAVAVFLVSWIAWMALPHHKPDFHKLADEDALLNALRSQKIGPGVYLFPGCDMKEMKDPAKKARWEAGPHGSLAVLAGRPNFVKNLVSVFIFYVVVSFLTAYVTSTALAPGAEYLKVFRIAGAVAIMAYSLGGIPHGLFFGRTARAMAMDVIDGVVYGLVTAGFFAWLWPAAAVPAIPSLG